MPLMSFGNKSAKETGGNGVKDTVPLLGVNVHAGTLMHAGRGYKCLGRGLGLFFLVQLQPAEGPVSGPWYMTKETTLAMLLLEALLLVAGEDAAAIQKEMVQ